MRPSAPTRLLSVWIVCLLVAATAAATTADRGVGLRTEGGRAAGLDRALAVTEERATSPTTAERADPTTAKPPSSATPADPVGQVPAPTEAASDDPSGGRREASTGSSKGPGPTPSSTDAPARPPTFDARTVRIPVPHGAAVDARVYCCASMHGQDLATWADPWIPPGLEGWWQAEAGSHALQGLRTVGGAQPVSLVRMGHVPTATATLVETWAASGALRSKVSPTAYVPGRVLRSGESGWVPYRGGEVWVTVRGSQLEVSSDGFDQGSAPSAAPWVMRLDDTEKLRRYVSVHRNRVGELYTTERSEPFFPAAPPPIGTPTRYDDHEGFGHVIVVRTGATSVTVTESRARADGTYGPVPPQLQAALGGPCLVMWHSLQHRHARCFSVVTDGSRITAMGFHDVSAPVPGVR